MYKVLKKKNYEKKSEHKDTILENMQQEIKVTRNRLSNEKGLSYKISTHV